MKDYFRDAKTLAVAVILPVIVTTSPIFEASLELETDKIATKAVERSSVIIPNDASRGRFITIVNEASAVSPGVRASVHAHAAAEQARAAVAEAETLRAAAIRAWDAADAAARTAERAQLRAEGQLAALEQRLAEDLAAEAAGNAGRLQVELAERTATLRATDAALTTERERARELDHAHRRELHERDARLAAAREEQARQLTQLRAEHERTIAELRTEHSAALDAARAVREDALVRIISAHADQLGAMRQRLGAAEHELTQLRDAAAAGGEAK